MISRTRGRSSGWLCLFCLAALLFVFPCPGHAQESGTVEETTAVLHQLHTSPVAPGAPMPQIDLYADSTVGSLSVFGPHLRPIAGTPPAGAAADTDFLASGNVNIYGGDEFLLHSDTLFDDQVTGVIAAQGHVHIREIDTDIFAKLFSLDEWDGTVTIEEPIVHYSPIFLSADLLTMTNGVVTVVNATVSAQDPRTHPDVHVTARTIVANFNSHTVSMRNMSIYIRGTRLITLKKARLRFEQTGTSSNTQGIAHSVGSDAVHGLYVTLSQNLGSVDTPIVAGLLLPTRSSVEGSLQVSHTYLLRVGKRIVPDRIDQEAKSVVSSPLARGVAFARDIASEPGAPLPLSDPLLFHDFLGANPLESLFNRPVTPEVTPLLLESSQIPVYGRSIGNLSYSSQPEAGARLDIPVLGDPDLPDDRNPVEMRAALRRLYLFAEITGETSRNTEEPSGASSSRDSVITELDTRPVLIGPNLLLRPRVSFYDAQYPTYHDRYAYQQIDIALQRSFSVFDAVGLEYIGTSQDGTDPFIFDTVDTSQELDLRAQTKVRFGVVGGRIKYDLITRQVFNWEADFSFPGGTVVPTITYQNPGNAIGLELNVPGLTFW